MGKKYTAADFANARFAEHPNPETVDAQYAARMSTNPRYPWLLDGVPGNTDSAMAETGWVPVPTKPTLTDSKVKKMVGDFAVDDFAAGFAGGFRYAGGEIVPDPEPTNAEKLEQLYGNWSQSNLNPPFGEWADSVGVKAPEEWGTE